MMHRLEGSHLGISSVAEQLAMTHGLEDARTTKARLAQLTGVAEQLAMTHGLEVPLKRPVVLRSVLRWHINWKEG